eukprot:5359992-Pyramimonas_sp.AAC.1
MSASPQARRAPVCCRRGGVPAQPVDCSVDVCFMAARKHLLAVAAMCACRGPPARSAAERGRR